MIKEALDRRSNTKIDIKEIDVDVMNLMPISSGSLVNVALYFGFC